MARGVYIGGGIKVLDRVSIMHEVNGRGGGASGVAQQTDKAVPEGSSPYPRTNG